MKVISVRRKVIDRNGNVDNRLELTFAAKSFLRQNFLTSLCRDLASRSTCNDTFFTHFTLD